MEQRYTRIFALDAMVCTPGAPVLIEAGALLRDSYSGELLCQLKLSSLSEAPIKAVTAEIRMQDIALAPIGAPVQHQYLDLALSRGEAFGRDTAIILPRRDARAFTVSLTEVIFSDNSRWYPADGCEWLRLPPRKTLEDAYGDAQLAEQFRIRYGADCRDMPRLDGPLWLCTCGAVNTDAEACCFRCRRVRSALLNVNTDSLREEVAVRLKQEALQQEEDKVDAKKRRLTYLKIAGIVLPLLILAIGLIKAVPVYVAQRQSYAQAAQLLAAGRYEDAAEAFSALDGYKDSAEQVGKNVPYQRALAILQRADANDASALGLVGHSRADLTDSLTPAMLLYEGAMAEFEALGGYKDSAAMVARCREGIAAEELALRQQAYEAAVQLLEAGGYSQAREQFLALEDYEDSAVMAEEAVYRKAIALYQVIESFDIRRVQAELSLDPQQPSSFSLPKSAAADQGSQCLAALRDACGQDPLDIQLTDTSPDGQRPLADCVTELFAQLNGYKDSEERIRGIAEATDYTREFFELCANGELYAAYDWLSAYDGEFPNRNAWRALLELYIPYCTSWKLYGGDATVIPLTVGHSQPCENFSTQVFLNSNGSPKLRITANDGGDYIIDLYADPGEIRFSNGEDENYTYLLAITNSGRLSYMKYSKTGKLITSCEYSLD